MSIKIVSWNIGKYLGERDTSEWKLCKENKFEAIRDLIKTDQPEIFCIIEGTPSQLENTELCDLFVNEKYFSYYNPSMVKLELYKDLFDYEGFDLFGLKIFVKDSFRKKILPFDPARSLHKGRLINLELSNQKGVFIFVHRNMSSNNKLQDKFIEDISDWCRKTNLGSIADNIYLIGDFNLAPWDESYFSLKSGYLITDFIERIYKIRSRNNLCFYNPVVQHLSNSTIQNLGGTFFNSKHNWAIYDYVLIKNYDDTKQQFEIITSTPNVGLLNSDDETLTSKFFNRGFDHLPIKLELL